MRFLDIQVQWPRRLSDTGTAHSVTVPVLLQYYRQADRTGNRSRRLDDWCCDLLVRRRLPDPDFPGEFDAFS
jgi:hypothetical protein